MLRTEYDVRYRKRNRERIRKQALDYYYRTKMDRKTLSRTPEYKLYHAAKMRSKKSGIEFDLQLSDIIIPEFCPVFGIKIIIKNIVGDKTERKGMDNSPSIDRVDNSKGYTKDNIKIISWRANKVKSDSNLKELEAVISYIRLTNASA